LIGIDTNVLVRFLAQDDPVQSKLVTRLLKEAEAKSLRVRVNLLVLVETCWVLKTAYDHPAEMILDIVERILDTKPFQVECDSLVREALERAKQHRHELPDVLIAVINRSCSTTLTFDKKASKLSGFSLLS
jgi:predicted nucleic-acid-binding protein